MHRVSGMLWVGNVTLYAINFEIATERSTAAILDDVTGNFIARRFSHQAGCHFFITRFQYFNDFHRAIN